MPNAATSTISAFPDSTNGKSSPTIVIKCSPTSCIVNVCPLNVVFEETNSILLPALTMLVPLWCMFATFNFKTLLSTKVAVTGVPDADNTLLGKVILLSLI